MGEWLGPLIGTIFSALSAMYSARRQRAFAQNQANSQYQRAVQDMRLAGLNPAMMFGGAGPAPVAQGEFPSPLEGVGDVASSAFSYRRIRAETARAEAEAEAIPMDAGSRRIQAEASATSADAQALNAQTQAGFLGLKGAEVNSRFAAIPGMPGGREGALLEARVVEAFSRVGLNTQHFYESLAREDVQKVLRRAAELGLPYATLTAKAASQLDSLLDSLPALVANPLRIALLGGREVGATVRKLIP